MQQSLYILFLMIAALMTGCAGSGDQKDATGHSQDAGFYQAMEVADSLYSCMQFRDAYKMYLQLLDSKEAEADSEKRLSVLSALSTTSELSGHKAEQHKWLQQLLNLATQTGNDYYQSLASITMGQNLFFEGNHEKGIYCVNLAIDLMAKTNRENTDHLVHGYLIRNNRVIRRKNQLLAAQITEAINYKKMYWDEKLAQAKTQTPAPAAATDDLKVLNDEQLFQHINEVVMQERLFLDPSFDRQAIMDRFQLSKKRVGTVFSKGSGHVKLNSFILQLRLEHAARLLTDEPESTILQIATDSGFGSSAYFSDRFRQHYGMSPSDYRTEAKPQSGLTKTSAE